MSVEHSGRPSCSRHGVEARGRPTDGSGSQPAQRARTLPRSGAVRLEGLEGVGRAGDRSGTATAVRRGAPGSTQHRPATGRGRRGLTAVTGGASRRSRQVVRASPTTVRQRSCRRQRRIQRRDTVGAGRERGRRGARRRRARAEPAADPVADDRRADPASDGPCDGSRRGRRRARAGSRSKDGHAERSVADPAALDAGTAARARSATDAPDQADRRRDPCGDGPAGSPVPPRVDIRCRNPCRLARLRLFGW